MAKIEDIVEESEKNKELEDIIKEVESSYVLRGLKFVDNNIGLKKYFPDSKAAKGFDYMKDFLFYSAVGFLPGEKQEKYAKGLGYDKLKFTKYSIAADIGSNVVKLGAMTLTTFFPPASIGVGIWIAFSLTDSFARGGYVLVKKKPIGTIPFMEAPYRIGKHFLKKKQEKKELEELEENLKGEDNKSKDLNSFDYFYFS
ncbi:MAG: hypothetical protein KKA79_08300 [Nanoarchaeota archaeon]|nr:hypothetical protein [Nanoarchaeota archaeon]